MAQLLYSPTIQEAIATGDLARMKKLAAEAEQHLKQVGDVRAALENLKIEIAKASIVKPGH
jgi:HPt (histidine-containing phosphotransfer) domain-containing protein